MALVALSSSICCGGGVPRSTPEAQGVSSPAVLSFIEAADKSIRFTDFHVAPMCTPTRGQLMTGVDCLRDRAMNVSSGRTLLRRDLPTMADLFATAGYAAGIFGKWHLGDNYPYRPQDRGFHETLWYPSSHIGSAPDCWDNDYFDDTYWDDKPSRASAEAAEASGAAGASWGLMLEKVNQRYPFSFRGAADDPLVYATLRKLTAP